VIFQLARSRPVTGSFRGTMWLSMVSAGRL
jgi:hypothetical protein